MINNYLEKYFLVLFSIIPISIILGSTISIINISLIAISFLLVMLWQKKWKWLFDPVIKLLFLVCLYLIFNTLISLDSKVGIYRNLGFFRFIILFAAINYFFYYFKDRYKEYVFYIWLIIILLITIDIFKEVLTGSNLLGFGQNRIDGVPQPDGKRVQSFFKDKAIVGSFLLGFVFLVFGYLLKNFSKASKIKKLFIVILPIFFFIALLFTGERSNFLKFLVAFFIFFIFMNQFKLKIKIILITICLSIMFVSVNSSEYIKMRYADQFFSLLIKKESRDKFIENNIYFRLYKSGLNVFQNYPIFGVGNKNYRVETCLPENNPIAVTNENNTSIKNYICEMHPHQIYVEFLAEHGIVGTVILLSVIFFLIFRHFKSIVASNNYIQLGCMVYLISVFVPILPNGSLFNDYNATLFWLNMSLMYAVNPNTNIFKKTFKKPNKNFLF